MWYSAIGCIVTLILSTCVTPHIADAQQARQVFRVGFPQSGSGLGLPSVAFPYRAKLKC